MKKIIFLLFSLIGFGWFLWGVVNIYLHVESNACHMTYMLGAPQYFRLRTDRQKYPNYGLYYYYEGPRVSSLRKFTGAPVIFVPGNGGSYKQVRSLASVAIRKSIDLRNKLVMDYFTIDYDEELSGLHGGYLQKQQLFLQHCIATVLDFYKSEKKVVLIGHSMGGKVAQSILLQNNSLTQMVNSIIFISTPLDEPVVYFDALIADFYNSAERYLRQHRLAHVATNSTDCCGLATHNAVESMEEEVGISSVFCINDTLLLSIGGGNRDLLVNDVLTTSIYNDVHAMTSAIPHVWLSCDHLAAVWCLELVLVINRFLFQILNQDSSFTDKRLLRLQQAQNYFGKSITNQLSSLPVLEEDTAIWREVITELENKVFPAKRKAINYQVISLEKFQGKTLYAELTNLTDTDWIFGCSMDDEKSESVNNATLWHCEQGINLSNKSIKIPGYPRFNRMAINIRLTQLSSSMKNLTHLVIRIPITNHTARLIIDIHNNTERRLTVQPKSWHSGYELWSKATLKVIERGAAYFQLAFPELQAPSHGLRLYIDSYNCKAKTRQPVAARICIPWQRGFDQTYQYRGAPVESTSLSFLLVAPIAAPTDYNSTEHPLEVALHLDPQCRHAVSYSLSYGGSMARIIRNYFSYLPAHLAAILLLALRQHMCGTVSQLNCITLLGGFLQPISTLILALLSLSAYGLFVLLSLLPAADSIPVAIIVQLLMHCTAIIAALLLAWVSWLLLLIANCIARTLGLWVRLSNLFTALLETIGHLFSFSLAVVLISIACYGSGGVALIFACLLFLIRTARHYEATRQHLLSLNHTSAPSADEQATPSADEQATPSADDQTPPPSAVVEDEQLTKEHPNGCGNIYVQVMQFLLLLLLVLLDLPASIASIKSWQNYPNYSLPDHTLVSSLVVLGCLAVMWQLKCSIELRFTQIVGIVLYLCACLSLLIAQVAIFRLTFIVAFVFVIILFQQILSSALMRRKTM